MCHVSLIIVNWNGRHLLRECLDAVMAQTYRDFEVILVDNGSTDDSCAFVSQHYSTVRLMPLTHNRGFTGGNIAGYQQSRGRYIALLNNDTRPEPQWLEALVGAMEQDSSVGICASRIIIDGTDTLDSVGDSFTTAFSGTKIGRLQPAADYPDSTRFHGGCAAAILYSRAMLDEIGFLDEDFFFNHEDTDLNLRAWLAGWQCQYVPTAIVHHKVSASIGELSERGVYYFSRNTEWVWIKNVPLGLMMRYLPQRLLYEFASFGYFCVIKRRWHAFFQGKLDALKGLAAMLTKRRQVQRLIVLKTADIRHGLIPLSGYFLKRLVQRD